MARTFLEMSNFSKLIMFLFGEDWRNDCEKNYFSPKK